LHGVNTYHLTNEIGQGLISLKLELFIENTDVESLKPLKPQAF